jgi:2-keto-3-deoxy-L-rhamnonate aldolase RhmA
LSDEGSIRGSSHSSLERLRRREPVFGIMQTLPSPTLTELAVWSGCDFVILDCEHGIVDEAAHVACLQIIANSGAFAAVRLRPKDFNSAGRYLDFGADAILLPDVQTPADAVAFVSAATYGPRGNRSSTRSSRSSRYGMAAPAETPPLLFAMIEGNSALRDLTAIAATPGISGFIVGPNDLSADLGCPFEFSAPAYSTAISKIEQTAADAQLLMGTIPHPHYPTERLLAAGHRLIIVSSDVAIIRDGCTSQLAAARAALARTGTDRS